MMSQIRMLIAACACSFIPLVAHAVQIKTVVVGNAGNAPDIEIMSDGTTGYGAVPYEYRIGKYEVTNAQYADFLNAVDPAGTNPLDLYYVGMSTHELGGIDLSNTAPSGSKYAVKSDRANHPVIYVNWYSAIRFANWLHNGQGSGDTETGAYTLGPLSERGSEPLNGKDITRNPGARWFLPSEDEWYKAAFHKNDGATGNYWNFATKSDTAPTPAVPPGMAGAANFNDAVGAITEVGAYELSPGPYGTFDQAGNLWEWNEVLLSHGQHFSQVMRGMRGGGWFGGGTDTTSFLAASHRGAPHCEGGGNAGCSSIHYTFRVGSLSTIPEPGSWLLALMGAAFGILGRRRRNKKGDA
jgi:MYXO-CTERM domain-containing protein